MPPKHKSSPIILDGPAKIALAVVAVVWLTLWAGGGSARSDVLMVVSVRAAAVVGLALLLLLVPTDRLRPQRAPLLFAGAIATVLIVQLIPLPPALWASLPGRDFYQALAGVEAVGPVWRPISFAPDLTWNSLLSLLPPILFLLAVPILGLRPGRLLLIGLLITILVSGLVGLLQMAGGADSSLRFYKFSNNDSATGFFANRNHQAAFLAMGIPLAAWWAGRGSMNPRMRRARWLVAGSGVMFLLTAAVTTQSRTGAALVALSLVLSAGLVVRGTGMRKKTIAAIAGGALAAAALGGFALTRWSESRLGVTEQDLRIKVLPETIEAARTFFPVGAGWGSFAQVYPRFESLDDLSPEYLNHAHTELTQIVIEGGVAAIILLLVFLLWFVRVAWRAWASPNVPGAVEARLCTVLVAIPLAASITDYPLRTPLMACAFAAAAAMLAIASREVASRRPESARAGV